MSWNPVSQFTPPLKRGQRTGLFAIAATFDPATLHCDREGSDLSRQIGAFPDRSHTNRSHLRFAAHRSF